MLKGWQIYIWNYPTTLLILLQPLPSDNCSPSPHITAAPPLTVVQPSPSNYYSPSPSVYCSPPLTVLQPLDPHSTAALPSQYCSPSLTLLQPLPHSTAALPLTVLQPLLLYFIFICKFLNYKMTLEEVGLSLQETVFVKER